MSSGFSLTQQPNPGQGRLIGEVSRSHTHCHTTVGRTPLDEGSAFRIDLYLATQQSQETDIHASSLVRFLNHTQCHTTVGRTPLDEGSALRIDLYLATQQSQETDIHVPRGIRTCNPTKRATVDPCLRPLGHWDRHSVRVVSIY